MIEEFGDERIVKGVEAFLIFLIGASVLLSAALAFIVYLIWRSNLWKYLN